LVNWQLQPKRILTPGESPIEDVEAVDTNVEALRFDDEVWEGCDKIVTDLAGTTLLSALLSDLECEGCPAAVQDVVTLRLLEHFDPEDDGDTRMHVHIADVDGLCASRCVGDDLFIETILKTSAKGH
jgi:hypothetical protein